MKRVYYEVSGLLPVIARVIEYEEGKVVEYLGDGALALFQLPGEEHSKADDHFVYAASRASRNCLDALQRVVNPSLRERFNLPELEIGIGLAYSKAMITGFGLRPDTQPKVIGECIYFASKLAKGDNEIMVHEYLENMWPKGDSPKVRFHRRKIDDINAFVLEEIAGN